MRIVVDCANGAMSEVAPSLLRRLGADVTVITCDTDGHEYQCRMRRRASGFVDRQR